MGDGNVRTHSQDSLAANGVLNKLILTIWNGFISMSTSASNVLKREKTT